MTPEVLYESLRSLWGLRGETMHVKCFFEKNTQEEEGSGDITLSSVRAFTVNTIQLPSDPTNWSSYSSN